MSATADQIAALGLDSHFQQRVKSLFIQQASVVYAESAGTQNHAIRLAFAKQVLQGNANFSSIAMTVANRPNLIASTVSYNFTSGFVNTDATDAAIASQVATDWDMFSGV